MAKFHFRYIAIQDTQLEDLEGTIIEGMDGFSVYYFREGEATHICSFTPSSAAAFVECDYLDHATCNRRCMTEQQEEEIYELDTGDVRGDIAYLGYVDMRYQDRRFVSERVTCAVDVRKHKQPGRSWDDAYKAAAEEAWKEMEEYACCNGRPLIPVLDHVNVWRDHQREQAPRIIPRLPLFAYAAREEMRASL